MDEEALVLRLIASVIDIYDDYSHLARKDDVRRAVDAKLEVVRQNLINLMQIPVSDEVYREELTIESSRLKRPFNISYLKFHGSVGITIDEAIAKRVTPRNKFPDLRKIRSIISQIVSKSTSNQLVVLTCEVLVNFIEVYEKSVTAVEDAVLNAVFESFTYEYFYHRKLNNQLEIDPTLTTNLLASEVVDPLKFRSTNADFQQIYDKVLLQALAMPSLPADHQERMHLIERRIEKVSKLFLDCFKTVSHVCYFFDIKTSIMINNCLIDFVSIFCAEESKNLYSFIKEYFNKNPVLPELEFLLEYHRKISRAEAAVSSVNLDQRGNPVLSKEPLDIHEEVELVFRLLYQISNAFKTYELIDRELEEAGLSKLTSTYYEFRFPDVFKIYVHHLADSMLSNDPYYNAVKFEILKYQNFEINADCWDIPLHNLCKIMFGTGGTYKSLKTTAYHKFAVIMYAKSQATKRRYLLAWNEYAATKIEEKALLLLYDKTLKRRVISKWINRFVTLRSYDMQAVKYKQACNRNLAFSKWLSSYQKSLSLDDLSNKFVYSKFLSLWSENCLHSELNERLQSFLLKKKRVYYNRFSERFHTVKSLDRKSSAFVITKLARRFKEKTDLLRIAESAHNLKFTERYFDIWRKAISVVGIKEVVQYKNDQQLKRWAFGFWSQRSQERRLCAEFRSIKDDEILKNSLFMMLLIHENNELAREFQRKRLLARHMKKLLLETRRSCFKHERDLSSLQKHLNQMKLKTRLSLMKNATESDIVEKCFGSWRAKALVARKQKLIHLERLGDSVAQRFKNSQRDVYLKYFIFKWEEATIKSLEKQEVLNEIYDESVIERYTAPFFYKWRSVSKKMVQNNRRAEKFERDVTCATYFGVMLDRFADVQYLEQLSDEALEMAQAKLASSMFKKWSLKSLKVRSNKNLIDEFSKRSAANKLRNFFMIWRETVAEKDEIANTRDNSLADSSFAHSPLLHRYPKRLVSNISLRSEALPPTSTPLVNRVSPGRRRLGDASARRIRTPLKIGTPDKSSQLNSESFRKSQVAELRTRYQSLKYSPSSDSSLDYSFSPNANSKNYRPPPAQPSFLDRQSASELEAGSDSYAAELILPATSDSKVRKARINAFVVSDEIVSPTVSPVAVLREKLRNEPSRFSAINPRLSEEQQGYVASTRSSSATFVERLSDDIEEDHFFEPGSSNDSVRFRDSSRA